MSKRFFMYIGIVAMVFLIGYTSFHIFVPENTRVKRFGSTVVKELPVNQKLVNVTWKDDHFWLLTKEMTNEDRVETYKFSEQSKWGVIEGIYIIKERKNHE